MTADLLESLLRVNLALAGGVAFVMLLRSPVRLWFGARLAYALWLIPPLAALATLLPKAPEIVRVAAEAPASEALGASAPEMSAAPIETTLFEPFSAPDAQSINEALASNLPPALSLLWIVGVVLSLVVLGVRQWRYGRALGKLTACTHEHGVRVFRAETNAGGPAVIGVVRPKIVTPADFDSRYSADERRAVIAHECAHMRHGDPAINAFAAALQSLCWFNPAVYFGVQALRVDQELACDAAVLERAQAHRRVYAEAMLKSQVGDVAPLGCAWPPASIEVLKERISMLKTNLPSKRQTALGAGAVAIATIAACGVAWTAQPARTITIIEHANVQGLEGGAEDETAHGRDHLALRERVRLAVDDARRRIDTQRLEMLAQRDAMMAQRDAMRAQHVEIADRHAEALELQRQAMEVAREAIEQAHREVAEETAALALEGEDPQALELGREAQSLAAQALALAARAMSEGGIDAAEEARIEAEMERRAVRISELAMRVGAEASERSRIEVERAHRQMARPPEPALAPRAPEAPHAVAPTEAPRAPMAPPSAPQPAEAPQEPAAPY